MIHRALLGSFERFIGIMLEHYGGELPLWLVPVQAIVLPLSDRFNDYGARVQERLRADGLRVERDEQTVSVREHRGGDSGSTTLEKFSRRFQGELYSPALQPQKSQERDA
jgi:threonyl-tRNA synthetase